MTRRDEKSRGCSTRRLLRRTFRWWLQRFWDMYPLESIDLPEIPDGHLETLHPVYQRMRAMFGCADYPEELVRRARAGYYALISYVDEKIGRLLDALEASGQADNTLVIHFSDHGDMNGEHGYVAQVELLRRIGARAASDGLAGSYAMKACAWGRLYRWSIWSPAF